MQLHFLLDEDLPQKLGDLYLEAIIRKIKQPAFQISKERWYYAAKPFKDLFVPYRFTSAVEPPEERTLVYYMAALESLADRILAVLNAEAEHTALVYTEPELFIHPAHYDIPAIRTDILRMPLSSAK